MKKTLISIISSLLVVVFSSNALFAKDANFIDPFNLDPLTDGIIGGTGLALTTSAYLCDNVFHIKENDGANVTFTLDANKVNSFDRPFIRPYSKKLDFVGDAILGVTLLTPTVMFASRNTNWLTVGVMYAETIALANGLKEWGKLLIKRPRPYTYFEPTEGVQKEIDRGDWHNSMPSGHTTMAFTGAAFTSAVFNEYFPDSPWRHVVTATSFGIATTVGIIRMCSGNHFLTDVLAGAAIGTFCGFIVPFFHSQTFNNLVNKNDKVQIAASPLSFNVNIKL